MRDLLFRKRFVALGLALGAIVGFCLAGGQALAGGNGVGSGGLQGFQPAGSSSLTPTNAPNVVQATTAAMSLFVDPTGSDSNACTSTGAGACLTIQGALNKVPRMLRHGVTVTVAAGTYGCFFVGGFTCDPSVQQTTGGLLIDGTAALTNSTLATGTATGTATAGSAGSGTTFGTLTNAAATWTVNDLTGRFIVITSGTGSGQTRVISSNTGTVVTVVGTWTAPDATSVYAIRDPGVVINTACSAPASTQSAASANNAAILIADNFCAQRTNEIAIQGIRVANTSGMGIAISDSSGLILRLDQIRNTAAASSQLQVGGPSAASRVAFGGRIDLQDIDLLNSSAASATNFALLRGDVVAARMLIRSGLVGIGLSSSASFLSASGGIDVQGSATPISAGPGYITALAGSHVTCSSTGTGIVLGSTTAGLQFASSYATISGAVVATCGTGILVNGVGSSADLSGLTGTAATTGIAVQGGGTVSLTSGTTITGGTNDINVDSGGLTAALADAAAGTCLGPGQSGSRACGR